MQSPCDQLHFLMSSGREEQAKNFMIFFSVGSFFLAAGIVFVASLLECHNMSPATGRHCGISASLLQVISKMSED